jgi:hypothetical protein
MGRYREALAVTLSDGFRFTRSRRLFVFERRSRLSCMAEAILFPLERAHAD